METPAKSLVAAPKEFFLAPVFAATRQTGTRRIRMGDTVYEIGGFNPFDPLDIGPPLDVRHAELVFTLLTFYDPRQPHQTIAFSISELCRRYAHERGGQFARDIRKLLNELCKSYIRFRRDGDPNWHFYRIIERIHGVQRAPRRKDAKGANAYELWIDEFSFSPEFFALLQQIVELRHLRLDVFRTITSHLAQAIYLYIPSRAHHHGEGDPFEITLTNLLQQVSHPVPEQKCRRHRLFTQNKHPILSQLDAKETLSGTFRAKLAETSDGKDWKLQCWVEKPSALTSPAAATPRSLTDSKMAQAFLASGKSLEALKRCLDRLTPLTGYERDLLQRGQVVLTGNERAFELAKTLLGEDRFDSLLAEAKGDALEQRKATKSPNHRLMSRLMDAIRQG